MNAKFTTLLLSSVVCTGLLSGLLVEPSSRLIGNLIQPAQAQACNGPTKSGEGTTNSDALQALNLKIALAGVVGCGPIGYTTDLRTRRVTATQKTRAMTLAEWGGTWLPEWAY
jgi:hypothetical protein